MRKALLARLAVSSIALSLLGCGLDDDYQAANRLLVTSITSGDGSTTVIANAFEKTDDSGTDGVSGTNDVDFTENNGRPDSGETIETPLENDLGTISFENQPRLGAGDGVDLSVYRVDITYRDGNGQSRSFAPTFSQGVSLLVPTGSTADLTGLILVPLSMKVPIRDIFLFPPSAAALEAVTHWTATVDVYAKDYLNNDNVHTQSSFPITFVEPM